MIGGEIKEYPVVIEQSKSRIYAAQSLYAAIIKRKERYLEQRILNEFLDIHFRSNKHHLLAKRNEEFELSIENRFNLRFGRHRFKRR